MTKSYIRHKVSPGETHNLSDKESEILISTGRANLEDPIWIIATNGTYLAKIVYVSPASVEVEIQQLVDSDYLESEGHALIQSVLLPDRMNQAIKQAVGIGFSEIIPIQPHYQEIQTNNEMRDQFQKVANGAQEQSLSRLTPIIYDITIIEELRMKKYKNHVKLCLSIENIDKNKMSDLLRKVDKKKKAKYLIAVGPPKGWHSAEIHAMDKYGFHMVTLGDAILRSENAALAALSAINFYQGVF